MTTQSEFEASLTENAPLAPMTTLGIGGAARFFAEVPTTDALIAGVEWARARALPLFVLGGGSNIVVAERIFPGLVLRISIRGVETRVDNDDVVVTAGAGEEWDPLVGDCVAKGWAGFECLSGIPGRVGATPIQNVGAYGQETSETLTSVEALNRTTGELVKLSARECEFGYRTSRFKTRDKDRFIIIRVTYRLAVDGKPSVRYPELQRHLAAFGSGARGLVQVRDAVLTLRRRKAMVIDPNDADSRSVGSFFVNPTVTVEACEQIKKRASEITRNAEAMPLFPTADGLVKLSAGWLIEQSGVRRGYVHGNVGTSTKHALAIINRGGGTATEIMELKSIIQQRVQECFGVALTPEPVLVGFET